MGRPEKPLTTANRSLRALQEWLRAQRARTGHDYRALSARAGYHATTLQRAASSETVPPLPTVLSYARACDASPEEARWLWRRARHEQTRRARGGRERHAPRPELVRDFAELVDALIDVYEKAGSPPLRRMERRAGGYGALPASTVRRILKKEAVPQTIDQFAAFLRVCDVPESDLTAWGFAWARAWRYEKGTDEWHGTVGPRPAYWEGDVAVEGAIRRKRDSLDPVRRTDGSAAVYVDRSRTLGQAKHSEVVMTRRWSRRQPVGSRPVQGMLFPGDPE
ncbi:helix-turn-helix transcriptional regulator [Streptomyces sp. DH12]|uniref:helix-turn-helix domain-containing protein n=1 Tax=Streptomyces sp. DH12 TaxID=2857010 RepID=UPI001E2D5836|nr:helix-turn-helix transcriptional regulator [Streptomyces sp. DH12]